MDLRCNEGAGEPWIDREARARLQARVAALLNTDDLREVTRLVVALVQQTEREAAHLTIDELARRLALPPDFVRRVEAADPDADEKLPDNYTTTMVMTCGMARFEQARAAEGGA